MPLTIEIVNDKPLPLAWLEVEDTVPGDGLESARRTPARRTCPADACCRCCCRCAGTSASGATTGHAAARAAVMPFGPAILRTGDVFGLATHELEFPGEDYLLVYPQDRRRSSTWGFPPRNPFGDVPLRRQWLFEDPLRTVGVRDYRPGDSPRRLHWKATARAPGQPLQVKLFEPTTTHRLHVLLNVSTSAQNWAWQGYDPEAARSRHHHCGVCRQLGAERGYLVGLAANAKLFHSQRGACGSRPAATRTS